jgi:hypothetical protein
VLRSRVEGVAEPMCCWRRGGARWSANAAQGWLALKPRVGFRGTRTRQQQGEQAASVFRNAHYSCWRRRGVEFRRG